MSNNAQPAKVDALWRTMDTAPRGEYIIVSGAGLVRQVLLDDDQVVAMIYTDMIHGLLQCEITDDMRWMPLPEPHTTTTTDDNHDEC